MCPFGEFGKVSLVAEAFVKGSFIPYGNRSGWANYRIIPYPKTLNPCNFIPPELPYFIPLRDII